MLLNPKKLRFNKILIFSYYNVETKLETCEECIQNLLYLTADLIY